MIIINKIIHFFKVRITAKKFNVKTCELDSSFNFKYWIGYDNKIYFGSPYFIFFYSAQNDWWVGSEYQKEYINKKNNKI